MTWRPAGLLIVALAAGHAGSQAKEKTALPHLNLLRDTTQTVDGDLFVDSPLLAATDGQRLRVLVRGRDRALRALTLDDRARPVAPPIAVPLETPTGLAVCGALVMVAGTSPAGGWRLAVLGGGHSDGGDGSVRVVDTPAEPRPLCIGGQGAAAFWEADGARVALATVGDALGPPRRVELGGGAPHVGVISFGDGVAVIRAGAGPIEVAAIDAGPDPVGGGNTSATLRARVTLPGTEVAIAPSLTVVGDRLAVTYARPGRPQRLMLQWLDGALATVGAAEELTALAAPRAFARSYVVPGAGDRLAIGYTDCARLATHHRQGAQGAPVAHRTASHLAVYDAGRGRVGPFQDLADDGNAACHWLGDRLISLDTPIGALRATIWSVSRDNR